MDCELPERAPRQVEDASGVTIIGKCNYPAEMPGQASFFLSQNFLALLELVGGGTGWNVDITDQVVQQMTVPPGADPLKTCSRHRINASVIRGHHGRGRVCAPARGWWKYRCRLPMHS